MHIPYSSQVSPLVAISVGGVTMTPQAGDKLEDYLKLADTMLYDAKRLGRNQVVWSGPSREQWREK